MENIGHFLTAIEEYGVPKTDSFQTVDLYEEQNIGQVINAIHALGRKVRTNTVSHPPPILYKLSRPNPLLKPGPLDTQPPIYIYHIALSILTIG